MLPYPDIAICTSDWHLTARTPVSRNKGYTTQQFDKVEWILNQCKEYGAVLYNAGDIFNRAREPRWLVSEYQALLREYEIDIIACAGQHDAAYHSKDLSDTSINSLYSSGLIQHTRETVDWGGDISVDVGVLIAHYCVTEKPNPFISYSVTATKFMSMTKAKLIVTGDYHPAHYLEKDGRLLVNPGSIMRNASSTIDKRPSVYLVDVKKGQLIDTLYIPTLPSKKVFDLSGIKRQKKDKKRREEMKGCFDEYINNAVGDKVAPDFPKNVTKVIFDTKPGEEIKKEIDSIMETVT